MPSTNGDSLGVGVSGDGGFHDTSPGVIGGLSTGHG